MMMRKSVLWRVANNIENDGVFKSMFYYNGNYVIMILE